MTLRVLEQLDRHAQQRGGEPAVVQVTPLCAGPVSMTYGELQSAVNTMAGTLAARCEAGDVVMLCAYNRPQFVAAYLGALAADLIVFPVYPGLSDAELKTAAARSGARAFVSTVDRFAAMEGCDVQRVDVLDLSGSGAIPPERAAQTNAAMLLQSSGTTGSPKIVYRTGRSLDAVARNVVEAVGLSSEDRVLAAIPLCHSYGVENGLLAPLYAGCTVHVADGFDPKSIIAQFAQQQITVFPGTPFMFEMLAQTMNANDAPSLRAAYSAGAPLPRSVASEFANRTGVTIGQLYGSTEIGSVTFSNPADASFDPVSVGRPMRDVQVRILDVDVPDSSNPLPVGTEGHVAIAAPSMLQRYVDDDQPALHDGYFFTGDLGRLDALGNLTITGRVKLQIDIGGIKVNPLEIEQVICAHPLVAECIVVPTRITATLDRLCALITASDPANPPTGDDLRQFARKHLSRHKVPRIFELRDALPRTPSGKIKREAAACS